MKCPECGEEMEEGYFILWASMVAKNYWSLEKPKYRWRHAVVPKDSIEVMWSVLPSIVLKGEGRDVLQGFRCPKCKIIIFHYEEEEKENKKKG